MKYLCNCNMAARCIAFTFILMNCSMGVGQNCEEHRKLRWILRTLAKNTVPYVYVFPDYKTKAEKVVNFILNPFQIIPKNLQAEEFGSCCHAYTERNNEFHEMFTASYAVKLCITVEICRNFGVTFCVHPQCRQVDVKLIRERLNNHTCDEKCSKLI